MSHLVEPPVDKFCRKYFISVNISYPKSTPVLTGYGSSYHAVVTEPSTVSAELPLANLQQLSAIVEEHDKHVKAREISTAVAEAYNKYLTVFYLYAKDEH